MTKKKESAGPPDDEKKLQEHFKDIQDTLNATYAQIDNIIFKLSCGGLTVSFTVLTYLADKGKLHAQWMVLIIWGLFAACIIGISISHIISRNTAKNSQDFIREMIYAGEKYDSAKIDEQAHKSQRPLRFINNFCFWILMANIVLTIVYTFWNFMS